MYVKNIYATYIDPTVHYSDHKCIILLILSAFFFLFIVLPPIIILLAYPTRLFRRLQNRLSSRVNLTIKAFVSTFQGCYKDGLNGTRDYRAMSGGILALFVVLIMVDFGCSMFVEIHDRQPIMSHQVTISMLIAFAVMMELLRPYKSEIANHIGVCLSALLIARETYFLFLDMAVHHIKWPIIMGVILLSLPHIVFYGYGIHRLWTKFNFKAVYCRSETRELEEQALIH